MLCIGMVCLASLPAGASDLAEISDLARSGATELAIELMDRHQPSRAEAPGEWIGWERERLALYRRRGNWEELQARVADYPDELYSEFLAHARTQQARALLELGRPVAARRVLGRLIWAEAVEAGGDALRQWRRLIIESHLGQGSPGDARTALRRFRQDYGDSDGDFRLLEARLFLQQGRGDQALAVLRTLPADEHRPLRLAARLDSEAGNAGAVLRDAIELGFDESTGIETRRLAWAVAARAAERTGNRSARVGALERGLGLGADPAGVDPIFRLTPEELWSAYQTYGERLGNEAQILVGDDPMWFERAASNRDSEPVKARALLSVVAFNSFDEANRAEAHARLAETLMSERHGPVVLRRLYLDAPRFDDIDAIPTEVRYHLARLALDDADIPLASELMAGLDRPPEDADPQEWGLQRARVLLLGGAREEGLAALSRLLRETPPEFLDVDRFLQVVFDLQNMGDHEPAYDYLMQMFRYPLTDQQQRELLFWAAESAEGMGDELEAARLYLKSAGHVDPFSMDQWAQTARYRAADALAEAGLVGDARRLYQSLLNATEDEARRAVLRNRIGRLRQRPVSTDQDD